MTHMSGDAIGKIEDLVWNPYTKEAAGVGAIVAACAAAAYFGRGMLISSAGEDIGLAASRAGASEATGAAEDVLARMTGKVASEPLGAAEVLGKMGRRAVVQSAAEGAEGRGRTALETIAASVRGQSTHFYLPETLRAGARAGAEGVMTEDLPEGVILSKSPVPININGLPKLAGRVLEPLTSDQIRLTGLPDFKLDLHLAAMKPLDIASLYETRTVSTVPRWATLAGGGTLLALGGAAAAK